MRAIANLKVWHPGSSGRTTSHIEDPDERGTCLCGVELGEFGGGQIIHAGEEMPDYVATNCRRAAKSRGMAG